MNNVKMYQAHKEPIRGIRYFMLFLLKIFILGKMCDQLIKRPIALTKTNIIKVHCSTSMISKSHIFSEHPLVF